MTKIKGLIFHSLCLIAV